MSDLPDNQAGEHEIFCIQLQQDAMSSVELCATEEYSVKRFGYLDGERLYNLTETATVVFCSWDKIGGKGHQFIQKFKATEKLKNIPLYVLLHVSQSDQVDKILKKSDLDGVILVPSESYKISILLYDLLHPEDMDDEVSDDLRDPELHEFKKPKFFKEMEVLDKIAADTFENEKMEKKRKEIDKDSIYTEEKVIVFHPDEAGGTGVAKQVKSSGCIYTEASSDITKIFYRLRSEKVRILILWYDEKNGGSSIDLLTEIQESRDLDRTAIVLMCPGEGAIKHFAKNHRNIFVDSVMLPIKYRKQLMDALDAAIFSAQAEGTPRNNLHTLRRAFRFGAEDYNRKPFSNTALQNLLKPIAEISGKEYWADSEMALNQLLAGSGDEAFKNAEILKTDYPESLDAFLIYGFCKAKKEGVKKTAPWLVKSVLDHRGLNPEKCYVLGKTLVRWKATDQLRDLMVSWYLREDLECDHQFNFILSHLYRLMGDVKNERRYLFASVHKVSWRAEYLQDLIRFMHRTKRPHSAEEVRKFALKRHRFVDEWAK